MKKQKEATYQAIKSVCPNHEDFQVLKVNADERKSIVAILVEGFKAGEIELKRQQKDLNGYCKGLLSNWLKKDKRFNGGIVHKSKNPGIRAGQGDPTVKNLRVMLKLTEEKGGSEADMQAIQEAIQARIAELKPKVEHTVDESLIPENLKHLL